MQANAIDEEDKAEVLNESQHVIGPCKAKMSGHDACEEHKRDAQRDASYFDASKTKANGDDQCVEQNDVAYIIGRKE